MSITRSLRYGAAELKRIYNRNLAFALVISVGVHLVLICLYLIATPAGAIDDPNRPQGERIVTTLEHLKPPIKTENPPQDGSISDPVVPSGRDGGKGGRNVFGEMEPVPDAMMVDDTLQISTLDHLGVALAQPRGEAEFGGGPDNGGDELIVNSAPTFVEKEPEIPEPDFVAVEKEPEFDMEELHNPVKYPDLALKNGIEGKVTVQVFVDRLGRPARVQVAESTNKLFNAAAMEAVQKTRFTPAIQNQTPIGVWVTIPIVFSLER